MHHTGFSRFRCYFTCDTSFARVSWIGETGGFRVLVWTWKSPRTTKSRMSDFFLCENENKNRRCNKTMPQPGEENKTQKEKYKKKKKRSRGKDSAKESADQRELIEPYSFRGKSVGTSLSD